MGVWFGYLSINGSTASPCPAMTTTPGARGAAKNVCRFPSRGGSIPASQNTPQSKVDWASNLLEQQFAAHCRKYTTPCKGKTLL